ncbi:hypothetical protein CC86DRAFT_75311 [Ophiobolus disseminans]|uniref:Uncharacterized protein n=1 Tax=Ophiobolus disseminans TaxID=1469910 RepID=A0A6A6ZQI0_9PLEO|nr:hypothetical protein CC86DRAFT_75311 [Ophiobolus disseminans]
MCKPFRQSTSPPPPNFLYRARSPGYEPLIELSDLIKFYRRSASPHGDKRVTRRTVTKRIDSQETMPFRSRKSQQRLDSVASMQHGTRQYGIPHGDSTQLQPPAGVPQQQEYVPGVQRQASGSSSQEPLLDHPDDSSTLEIQKRTSITVTDEAQIPGCDSPDISTWLADMDALEKNSDFSLELMPRTPLTKEALEANSRSCSTANVNNIDRLKEDYMEQLRQLELQNKRRLNMAKEYERQNEESRNIPLLPVFSFERDAQANSGPPETKIYHSFATVKPPHQATRLDDPVQTLSSRNTMEGDRKAVYQQLPRQIASLEELAEDEAAANREFASKLFTRTT